MILSFHPCFDAHVQIILGDRRLDFQDLELIRGAEAIILPQGCPEDLFQACIDSGAHIFPDYAIRFKYPGKMGQCFLFKDFGLPHPKTLRWPAVKEFKKVYPDIEIHPHKLPFLVKDNKSHEAHGVFIVKDSLSLSEALDYLIHHEKSGLSGFVTQDLVH